MFNAIKYLTCVNSKLSLNRLNFSQDEFKDKPEENKNTKAEPSQNYNEQSPLSKKNNNKQEASAVNLIDTSCFELEGGEGSSVISDLAGLRLECGDMPAPFGSFLPSQLLKVFFYNGTKNSVSLKFIGFCS